jgi:acetoin utilization deacetylase AcuC-like enzyme
MNMEVVVASHPSAQLHDTGRRHPERPARVEAVRAGIDESGLEIHSIESPPIERSELALVHDSSYIEMIHRFCAEGGGALDMDTFVSPESWEAALTAAGGVRALVEELESRGDATGFALSRPPGHHALANRAMGFCLFNNVAVATAYLRSRGERVAILDWDVHHGNGTQTMTGDDPGALYVSIHQDHFYPFEGSVGDIDQGDAKGTIVNIPLPAATAGDIYRRAWSDLVMPVVSQFEPSWLFVSAGFDAHADDHLAHLRLEASDFGWMAARLSETHPVNRTVVVLEGGYDLEALRDSARATVRGLGGETPSDGTRVSPPQSETALETAASAIARHWSI